MVNKSATLTTIAFYGENNKRKQSGETSHLDLSATVALLDLNELVGAASDEKVN